MSLSKHSRPAAFAALLMLGVGATSPALAAVPRVVSDEVGPISLIPSGLMTTQVMAGDEPPVNAHDVNAAIARPGPIIDGRHRQPTEAEVTAREEADGRSSASITRQNLRERREVDDLYREIMRSSNTPSFR